MRVTRIVAAAALLTVAAAGCHSRDPRTVVVFAASSLTPTFTALSGEFTDGVELNAGGSADLLTQLTHGADADVLATADTTTMDRAAAAGLLAGPARAFATNTLTIVVEPGNPMHVKGFRDLTRLDTVVCAAQVPCGAALPAVQAQSGVQLRPVSAESSVTDVLNKVISGQADAGVVYVTDARTAGARVTDVGFPEAAAMPNVYQIAVLQTARDPALARRFVELVTGPAGRQALTAAGFGEP